jgi:hypothetical protein
MPIKTPGGILEVEDAKLRASYLLANTSVGIGTSTTVPDGASLYIKEDNPTIRFQEGTTTSAARILAKSGTLRLESGTDYDQPELTGDIAFSNIQGGTTHMIIKGGGNVGIGKESPSQMLDVSGNVQVGTANLFVDTTTGRVGVGVTEMTSTFEVAGNTAIQEYPPQAMTGYETYMEGHGVFRTISDDPTNNPDYQVWQLFNKTNGSLESWTEIGDFTNGLYTGSTTLGSHSGRHAILHMPYSIKLKQIRLRPRVNVTNRFPADYKILGSNDNGSSWTLLATFTGKTYTDEYEDINSDIAFSSYAIVISKLNNLNANGDRIILGEWRLFGTPTPSSLEDGHLTLGKALTAPRVSGHPVGAETPRAESLVVHYDTTVDSVASGTTVVDTSGSGNNGTLRNSASYSSSEKAFYFDSASGNQHISTDVALGDISFNGNIVHSVSVWVKCTDFTGDNAVFDISGPNDTSNQHLALILHSSNKVKYVWYNNNMLSSVTIDENAWYHIALVYPGGGGDARKIYINGVYDADATTEGTNDGDNINILSDAALLVGTQRNTSNKFMNGYVSNLKIWKGVALTADEVAAEYALGRTGKSINITDTAVCLGGTVPRAQLDVRGSILIDGRLQIPGRVAFAGRKNNGTSSDTTSPLVFNDMDINVGDCYDTSNGRFTAPVNGLYVYCVQFVTGTSSGGTGNDFKINKISGSTTTTIVHSYRNNPGTNNSPQGVTEVIVVMNAGDYIEVVLVGSTTVRADYHNFIYGYLLE